MFIQLILVLSVKVVLGDSITRIHNADEFITFSKNVSFGTSYSGTTVYLDSDLSLSDKTLEPIDYFLGVFDGRGYIISNFKMNSSTSQYTGLFGYSKGLTIRNVVLDSSCSITNSFNGSNNVYIGGIIGYCYSISGECNIENVVNMADVTFGWSTNTNLFIGGIVGYLYSLNHPIYMKNCANYGSITHSGTSSNSLVGGIVGDSEGSSSSYRYIQDCVNYGAITHNGTSTNVRIGGIVGSSNSYISIENCANYGAITHNGSSSGNLYIGGIVGYSYSYTQNCLNYGTITHNGTSTNLGIGGIVGYGYSYTSIENCVSSGKIVTNKESNRIGSIVGRVNSNTHINYCYYTSDVNASSINGYGTPNSTTGTTNSSTSVNSDLVSNLNIIATSRNWNKWFMLHLNGGSINNLTQDPLVGIQGHIPNPVKEGNSFLFWCKDAECTEVFDPETVSGITELYAGWSNSNYAVTFDFDNGTIVNETFSYNTEIIYPDLNKEGYTLSWDNYHELMPAKDITVTAQWTPNNYTVTFDATGGSVSETSTIVTFNEEYGNLPESNRTGYMFLGWFTDNNKSVTSETTVTIPDNHTLYAHWAINNYTATFNFNNGVGDEVKVFEYNSSVVYPADPVREGYTLSWDNYHELMPANNITITAQWIPNNYTVSFDVNGGNIPETSMTVTFNNTYRPLPTPTKEGYKFIGWFTNKTNGTIITNETIITTPYNHTLHAQWEEVTTQVEIVFRTKDLTKEEVKNFIEQYTKTGFEIVKYEEESGEIRIVIKFTDDESAEEFFSSIKESGDTMNLIKRISFDQSSYDSISAMIYPLPFFNTLFL